MISSNLCYISEAGCELNVIDPLQGLRDEFVYNRAVKKLSSNLLAEQLENDPYTVVTVSILYTT